MGWIPDTLVQRAFLHRCRFRRSLGNAAPEARNIVHDAFPPFELVRSYGGGEADTRVSV